MKKLFLLTVVMIFLISNFVYADEISRYELSSDTSDATEINNAYNSGVSFVSRTIGSTTLNVAHFINSENDQFYNTSANYTSFENGGAFSGWFNWSDTTNQRHLSGPTIVANWGIYNRPGANIYYKFADFEGGSSVQMVTPGEIEKNKWYYFTYVIKDTGAKELWIDGVLNATSAAGSLPSATSALFVGSIGGGNLGESFDGDAYCVRFFNSSIREDSIGLMYNSHEPFCISLNESEKNNRPELYNITLINNTLATGVNQTCDSYPCTTSDKSPTFFGNSSLNSFYRISTRGNLNWTNMNSTNNCLSGNSTKGFTCTVSEGDKLAIGDSQCVYISAVNVLDEGNQTLVSTSGCLELNIVADTLVPSITLETGNSFSANNDSVISGKFYNVSLKANYVDLNLFQVSANVTCDTSGLIYYKEELDMNITSYTLNDTINISEIAMQRCLVTLAASDDHTDQIIGSYEQNELFNGIEFETLEKNNIKITTDGTFDGINTKKSFDRYSFDFSYKDNLLERTFYIEVDSKLYYRENSKYKGHFVVWNEEEHIGNWIDFEINDNPFVKYTVKKINDNKYMITIVSEVSKDVYLEPKKDGFWGLFGNYMDREELEKYYYGLDEVKFNSLGGTNVYEEVYEFYTGASVNVSTYNVYDNGSFENFDVVYTFINGTFLNNGTQSISGNTGLLVNVSVGNYTFDFSSTDFYSQSYPVEINTIQVAQNYTTYGAILNVYGLNIKTSEILQDLNITLYNNQSTFSNLKNDTTTDITTFYINASNYTINVTKDSYESANETFVLAPKTNTTLEIPMGFLASFFLYDERTLEGFNTTSADTITFFLFCPDETITTDIISNQTTIPISCNYDKFKFVLDYETTGYSRTLILQPDELGTVNVYLINLDTTDAIATTFIIDDLLQQYEDVSIYVNKVIENNTVQITADFIDIESKMVAYLIENHEYIIEVHSSNQPTFILGDYSAAEAGQKVIRLYDSKLGPDPGGFGNEVTFNTWSDNSTGDLLAYARYNDSLNSTIKVTWTLFEDNYDGAVIYNFTTTDPNFLASVNLTPFKEKNVASLMNIEHESIPTPYKLGKVINIWEKVTLGIMEYISQASLNWAILIIMSVIAVTSNIKSANITSLLIVGLAALLSIFGWITIGAAIMAFGALVAIISIFREPKTSGGY